MCFLSPWWRQPTCPSGDSICCLNINALDLYDNVWGWDGSLIFGMPMCTVMMRYYYADVPDALIKQAMIDGNGMWRIYRKVVLPNTKSQRLPCLYSNAHPYGTKCCSRLCWADTTNLRPSP